MDLLLDRAASIVLRTAAPGHREMLSRALVVAADRLSAEGPRSSSASASPNLRSRPGHRVADNPVPQAWAIACPSLEWRALIRREIDFERTAGLFVSQLAHRGRLPRRRSGCTSTESDAELGHAISGRPATEFTQRKTGAPDVSVGTVSG